MPTKPHTRPLRPPMMRAASGSGLVGCQCSVAPRATRQAVGDCWRGFSRARIGRSCGVSRQHILGSPGAGGRSSPSMTGHVRAVKRHRGHVFLSLGPNSWVHEQSGKVPACPLAPSGESRESTEPEQGIVGRCASGHQGLALDLLYSCVTLLEQCAHAAGTRRSRALRL
jgi:hypothetical protein